MPTERVQRSLGLALAGLASTKATSTLGSPRAGTPPLANPPRKPRRDDDLNKKPGLAGGGPGFQMVLLGSRNRFGR